MWAPPQSPETFYCHSQGENQRLSLSSLYFMDIINKAALKNKLPQRKIDITIKILSMVKIQSKIWFGKTHQVSLGQHPDRADVSKDQLPQRDPHGPKEWCIQEGSVILQHWHDETLRLTAKIWWQGKRPYDPQRNNNWSYWASAAATDITKMAA